MVKHLCKKPRTKLSTFINVLRPYTYYIEFISDNNLKFVSQENTIAFRVDYHDNIYIYLIGFP